VTVQTLKRITHGQKLAEFGREDVDGDAKPG
jgi:hypothetical protein